MPLISRPFLLALVITSFAALPSLADDIKLSVTLKDHKFTPDRLEAPKDTKIEITVSNEDSTVDEFDSHDLKREKVIGGGKTGVVIVGPLAPGEYHFQGEYHAQTAQGVLVIK